MIMNEKGYIGIVGGMGPLAGLDLSRNIIENTIAQTDQEHIPQILFSLSNSITDRSEFLQDIVDTNPGYQIAAILAKMEKAGCVLAAMACNTAHADSIIQVVYAEMQKRKLNIRLLHMIEETALYLKENYPAVKKAGILGTNGTVFFRVYDTLNPLGIEALYPETDLQKKVHNAIYDPQYGIKAIAGGDSIPAKTSILEVSDTLINRKADALLLACTELPIVFTEPFYSGIPVINPGEILARALIREHSPQKLKPRGVN